MQLIQLVVSRVMEEASSDPDLGFLAFEDFVKVQRASFSLSLALAAAHELTMAMRACMHVHRSSRGPTSKAACWFPSDLIR